MELDCWWQKPDTSRSFCPQPPLKLPAGALRLHFFEYHRKIINFNQILVKPKQQWFNQFKP